MQLLERAPEISPDPLPEYEGSSAEQSEDIPALPSPLTGAEVLEWARSNNIGKEDIHLAGELITQGEESDSVYVILGPGATVEHTVNDKPYYLATLFSGSIVGEISALTGVMPTASVLLERPTRMLEIPKEDFREIVNDPQMKERVEALIKNRLLMSADSRQQLVAHFEEIEAERMHETPNTQLREALNFQAALQEGLAEGKTVRHEFKICRMLGNSLEAEDFTVEYSPVGNGKYDVEVYGGDTTIPLTFSADGKEAATGMVEMGEKAGAGLYSRIMRYLLQDVQHLSAQIIEKTTNRFLLKDPRNPKDISSAELGSRSPVVAARKGFISTINSDRRLDSYRVDTALALILDISTDLERSLGEGTDKRLMDIYGTTTETTLSQLMDITEDYRQSSEYDALSENARALCDLQFDRITSLSKQYQQ